MPGATRARAWLWGWLLSAALMWGLPRAGAQTLPATPRVLTRMVRLAPGTRPLGEVLAELSRQGHLPFSYSSSLVPLNRPCTLRPGPARPLGVVLRELLGASHTSYGLVGEQLVLWPDHVAPPAGVVAVNGRTTPAQAPDNPRPLPATASVNGAASAAKLTSAATAPSRKSATEPGVAVSSSYPARHRPGTGPAPTTPTAAQYPRPNHSSTPARTEQLPDRASRPSGPTRIVARGNGQVEAEKSRPVAAVTNDKRIPLRPGPLTPSVARNANPAVAAALLHEGQPAGQAARQRLTGPRKSVAGSSPAASQQRKQLASRPGPGQEPLAPLAPRVVAPETAVLLTSPGALSAVSVPEQGRAALRQSGVAQPAAPADSVTGKPRTRGEQQRGGYLHGEAWVGESLPLNVALKLGIPRLHAVLGVATDPFGPGTDFAWGVGLGTAWQTRSRFRPSLDVMQWFVTGDREGPASRLTQLRPLLGWQLRPGGRWQLVGGPTLNLATVPRERGRPPRWSLGQEQWLWLNAESPRSLTRLWPGVQLGLRF